jgi:DNA-binding transcriptional ArsR family regulator
MEQRMSDNHGQPDASDINLGAVLSALADENRRRVVHDLTVSPDTTPRSCSSFGLDVSKSTLSHHFKVLREAGLVRQEDHGNRSGVTLRRADIEALFPGLLDIIAASPVD